ncbi:MAG TPA: alpha-amylase family glycosyl hydrolase [Candidatus Eisenbacteria bacterium]|nr:alpha-amylase family glycosyl hydrolase [Candidatus Eisenbacteria bacterium]
MPKFLRSLAPFIIALALSLSATAQPQITKVEPPNWWTGFTSPVMVLLYGENLNDSKVSVAFPGVRVEKAQFQPDGKHAFVWLSIAKSAKPGEVKLTVKNGLDATDVVFPLLQKLPQQGRFQGVARDDVIYLIMPDRFADGDPGNNMPKGATPGTYDRNAPKAYHGGDFKGIQEHLPYLKDLGVTTLWLNPIVDNDNTSEGYHGYGATDLYAVEDHFGTLQEFQSSVDAAHQQGIKVLLDMVPNHVGPKHPWATSQPAPGWLHGTTSNHINTDYDYPPVTDPHAVEKDYRSALDGWFANILPDLAQENHLVAEYLQQNALWWMEIGGVDGFRIDTFPYVPRTFWTTYLQRLQATYPNFFAVGEVYNFDPPVVSYFAGGQKGFDGIDTHLTTPFDFPMNSAIREVVNHGASAKKIVNVLRQDRLYPHPELLVTFIGNHDMKRFMTDAGGSTAKLKLGFSLLLTMRGIPQIYSGDEIAMHGGEDPDNRRDFPGGFPGDARNAFTLGGRTPEEQDVYAHVQGLLKLRNEHPALRVGDQKHVAVGDDYYLFTRETSGDQLLVVFYKGGDPKAINVDLADTTIANARGFIPINAGPAVRLQGSMLQLQLAPQSVAIYRVE